MGFGHHGLGGCGCCAKCAVGEECWSDDFSSYPANAIQELIDAGYSTGASMRTDSNERLWTRGTVFNFGYTGATRAIAFDPSRHTTIEFTATLAIYSNGTISAFLFPEFLEQSGTVGFWINSRALITLNSDSTYSTSGLNLGPINHGLALPGDSFGLSATRTNSDSTTIEADVEFLRNGTSIRSESITWPEQSQSGSSGSVDFCNTAYGVLGTGYSDNWSFEIDDGCD